MLKFSDEPSIIVPSTRFDVPEGNDVSLECNVTDGRPPPTVTWSKIGGLSKITFPPGQRLVIKNADRTEAGTYKCTADNGIGNPATATMDVNVLCKLVAFGQILKLIANLDISLETYIWRLSQKLGVRYIFLHMLWNILKILELSRRILFVLRTLNGVLTIRVEVDIQSTVLNVSKHPEDLL